MLYWNRDLCEEDLTKFENITFHEFKCRQEDDVSKLSKISSFVKYRNYAKKIIKNGAFDFIIVLHSLPGVLLGDILKKQFRNRYIFDYRDSTYEGFALYKKAIGGIVRNSKATFVSSDAFRKFFPQDQSEKIYTSHNLLTDSLLHRDEKKLYGTSTEMIRIAFWGFIRHEEINREIIRKIAADNRFELHYYGREQQIALNLKEYAKQIQAENVFFHGEYRPEDRYEFVRNTDIIHNIYCDDNMMLAMGNKYYDGIIFRIPQICMTGSFMGRNAVQAGVGLACDPYESDFSDSIYRYYTDLDTEKFSDYCDLELKRIIFEYDSGKKVIKGATLTQNI